MAEPASHSRALLLGLTALLGGCAGWSGGLVRTERPALAPASLPEGEPRAAGTAPSASEWPLPASEHAETASTPSHGALEEAFFRLLNEERTSRGLPELLSDVRLIRAARAHSKEMSELGYFDHRSPTEGLSMPIERFLKARDNEHAPIPEHLLLGENICHMSEINHVFNVGVGHRAIMASPSHKAAILEPRYTHGGVGVFVDAKGELWATQMFLREAPWEE